MLRLAAPLATTRVAMRAGGLISTTPSPRAASAAPSETSMRRLPRPGPAWTPSTWTWQRLMAMKKRRGVTLGPGPTSRLGHPTLSGAVPVRILLVLALEMLEAILRPTMLAIAMTTGRSPTASSAGTPSVSDVTSIADWLIARVTGRPRPFSAPGASRKLGAATITAPTAAGTGRASGGAATGGTVATAAASTPTTAPGVTARTPTVTDGSQAPTAALAL
mmetsp:Transcript_10453/g.20760  ORF Transcript_10453/g.20760 Transcript_10453/m.20760 type:complete len:220 (-) Transcript_10453:132-791(-)